MLPRASAVVVPFYMGLPPMTDIWGILAQRQACVVEDRCQCVGSPPAPAELCGDYAIGSYRKWMAVPDGAYCVRRNGAAPRPAGLENREMVRLRLAAALVKQTRLAGLPPDLDHALEEIAVELFRLGEIQAGAPGEGRQASRCRKHHPPCRRCRHLRQADSKLALAGRAARQEDLPQDMGARMRMAGPIHGPITGFAGSQCRSRQAASAARGWGSSCAVHWKDADWAETGGHAAVWAASTLSLPIDQRDEVADLESDRRGP